MGPKRNCITAKDVDRTPPQSAACASVPPPTSRIRSGITGTISPIPIASSMTVIRMKTMGRRKSGQPRAADAKARASSGAVPIWRAGSKTAARSRSG